MNIPLWSISVLSSTYCPSKYLIKQNRCCEWEFRNEEKLQSFWMVLLKYTLQNLGKWGGNYTWSVFSKNMKLWLSFTQVLLSLKGEWITETAVSQTSYNIDNWNEATLATTSSQVFMSLFIFFSNLTMKSDANICLAVLQFSSFISYRPQNVIKLRITSICRKCYDRQGH